MPSIDWSNPVIQGVLIAGLIGLLGAVVASIAGYQGAKAGARIAAGAAEADRVAAREARDADRADAKRDRFIDRKLTLAVDFLVAADLHVRAAEDRYRTILDRWLTEDEFGAGAWEGEIPDVGAIGPVRSAYQALDLVAPEVAPIAGDLYVATVKLGGAGLAARAPEDPRSTDQDREWVRVSEEWHDLRASYVAAVRKDLGVVDPDLDR